MNLVIPERLLNLPTRCEETGVDEGRDGRTRDRGPAELVNKLEREEDEVDPDGAVGRSIQYCEHGRENIGHQGEEDALPVLVHI